MANNNQNKGNNGYGNQYDATSLVEGLMDVSPSCNMHSVGFRDKKSKLEVDLESIIAGTLGVDEIEHLAIMPRFTRDGRLTDILCRAFFNTEGIAEGNIVRKGSGSMVKSNRSTILDLVDGGGIIGGGDFEISDNFKKVFSPLLINSEGKFIINSIPQNRYIAVLDLDFNALMCLLLKIKSDSPYNFTILDVKPVDNNDFIMIYSKFIDTGSRRRNRKGRNSRVNYQDLDREWAKQTNAYYKGRSF